jgi:hypothetical protein
MFLLLLLLLLLLLRVQGVNEQFDPAVASAGGCWLLRLVVKLLVSKIKPT